MVNFGERIAYWYLRLNGFFLVENFVLHGGDGNRTADSDLLGIRLKYSNESINGERLQVHAQLREAIGGFDHDLGVIVQVKTGAQASSGAAFEASCLRKSVEFIGALSPEDIDDAVLQLQARATVGPLAGWRFAKVLIAEAPSDRHVVNIAVDVAVAFIETRLAAHAQRKAADRLFFGDDLMQFLAWRSGARSDG